MISKTEFTVDEIAKAFHIPAFWIRHWIRRGKLEGYLLGGVLEDRVEAEALVDVYKRQERTIIRSPVGVQVQKFMTKKGVQPKTASIRRT